MTSTNDNRKRRIMIITADESLIEQIQNSSNSALFKSIVIDSDSDQIDLSHSMNSFQVPSRNAKRSKAGSLTCVVCGASALGYNFDAITCESCKAFFRRNALKDITMFRCRRANGCEINIDTRRRCSACRLAKCLVSGMRPDRLLTAEEKEARRQQIQENRKLTANDNAQKSSIRSFCESESSSVVGSRSMLFELQNPSGDRVKETRRPLMTTEDLKALEYIQNSYEKRFELATNYIPPWDPADYTNSLLQKINARSLSATRLLVFFKQIPEFNAINVDDKITLIKCNLMPLVIVNGTMYYEPELDQVKEGDMDIPWNTNTMKEIFGPEISVIAKRNFENFFRIAQFDRKIIILGLIILIFTRIPLIDTNFPEPVLSEPITVYRAQSYYIELLWKYMETVHGIEKAVVIFQQLMFNFLSWKTLHEQIRSRIRENLTPTDFEAMMPIMKSFFLTP